MPFLSEDRVDLPSKDILSWYFDHPKFDPEQPVYIDATNPDRYWTARQCHKAIRQLSAGFRSMGLKNGDCVCVVSFNSIDYPVLVNGIIGFGGVFTGCNPGYTKFELVHHLRSSQAQVIIAEPELLEPFIDAVKETGLPRSRILVFAPEGSSAEQRYGLKNWHTLFERGESDWPVFNHFPTAKNTTAALLFSSGTTGLPKAVMLSHHNMTSQYVLSREWKAGTWKKRRLVALPMFHAATAPLCHFSALYSGDQMFILRRFDLESFMASIERHQITDGSFAPPVVHAILSSPLSRYSLDSIRFAQSGAAPLDVGSQERFKNLLAKDAPFIQSWGMTETSCVCSSLPYEYGHDPTGSIGKILPNMDVKLCDDYGNDITADNVRGELCVRGPLVAQGYYLNEEANANDWDHEGFFHTGDIGYRDARLKLWYIVDRKKELIKVRGFQVSPSEIEGVVLMHADIIDAAVIGVRTRGSADGQAPRAYVICREGSTLSEEEIHFHLKQRLAKYKQCAGGIVIGQPIPKSPSGKKLKRILVEQAHKERASAGDQARL